MTNNFTMKKNMYYAIETASGYTIQFSEIMQ